MNRKFLLSPGSGELVSRSAAAHQPRSAAPSRPSTATRSPRARRGAPPQCDNSNSAVSAPQTNTTKSKQASSACLDRAHTPLSPPGTGGPEQSSVTASQRPARCSPEIDIDLMLREPAQLFAVLRHHCGKPGQAAGAPKSKSLH